MQRAGLGLSVLVLAAAAWVIFFELGQQPLMRFDEQTYSQVLHESLVRHDFFSLTYKGQAWLEKPPLYFWLAGASAALFGENSFSLRLPSALSGVAVVALAMLLSYEAVKKSTTEEGVLSVTPALVGMLLLLTPPFVDTARTALMDQLVSACILLAFWLALRRCYRWWGAAFALALLAKSAVGIFALVPLVFERPSAKEFAHGLGLALLISAPWHIYEWWRFGGEFWHIYLEWNILGRFSSNLFGSAALQTDYLLNLARFAPLITGLFCLAVVTLLIYGRSLARQNILLPVAAVCAGMAAAFFTSQTRALTYLVPLYPFAALLSVLCASFLVQRLHAIVGR